jgi:hypothetical protein
LKPKPIFLFCHLNFGGIAKDELYWKKAFMVLFGKSFSKEAFKELLKAFKAYYWSLNDKFTNVYQSFF